MIGRISGLSTLRHSYRLACQQRVLKMFPGSDYLHYKDGIVSLSPFLVTVDIYSSPFYLATAQSQCPMMIGRNSGLSTLCHNCRFACQQKVLKMFPGPGFTQIWDSLTMTFFVKFGYVSLTIYHATAQSQ